MRGLLHIFAVIMLGLTVVLFIPACENDDHGGEATQDDNEQDGGNTDEDTDGSDDGEDSNAGIHILSSGIVTVPAVTGFDFDQGLPLNPVGGYGDMPEMWWRGTNDALQSWSNARLGIAGAVDFYALTRLQVQACLPAESDNIEVQDGEMPVGTVVGFITNQGCFGKFRVDEFTQDGGLVIRWITWVSWE